VLFTILIVSKQLHSDNMKIIQHRSIIFLNIKCPQLSKPKARQQWQGTKTPSGTGWRKKNLGRTQTQSGASSPLANEVTVITKHKEYLSISIYSIWKSK